MDTRNDNAPGLEGPGGGWEAELSRAKGSFKLSLLETVASDPKMKPSDLAVVVAYCSVLQWPKRLAWLAMSEARARTGLSERQVNASRKRVLDRGYFVDRGWQGVNRLFELRNEREADMRLHVREAAEFYRDQTRQRQAARRADKRHVPVKSAGTETGVSQSPSDCDNPAKIAGNIPAYTPQYLAMKGSSTTRAFNVPASEDEADALVSQFLVGQGGPSYPTLYNVLRARLMSGGLTSADVTNLLGAVG